MSPLASFRYLIIGCNSCKAFSGVSLINTCYISAWFLFFFRRGFRDWQEEARHRGLPLAGWRGSHPHAQQSSLRVRHPSPWSRTQQPGQSSESQVSPTCSTEFPPCTASFLLVPHTAIWPEFRELGESHMFNRVPSVYGILPPGPTHSNLAWVQRARWVPQCYGTV